MPVSSQNAFSFHLCQGRSALNKDNVMTLHCLITRFTHLPMLLLALFALALQGCGDGVRILPQPSPMLTLPGITPITGFWR